MGTPEVPPSLVYLMSPYDTQHQGLIAWHVILISEKNVMKLSTD